MVQVTNKIFISAFAVLMMLAAALSGYFAEPLMLLVPVLLIASIYFIQHPEYLLYLLIATIPWSLEYHFNENLGTDLPDEPLMLLTAFAALILIANKQRVAGLKRIHPLVFVILIEVAWLIITVAFSTHFTFSLKYIVAKGWYLLAFLALPVFIFQDEKTIRRGAVILFISMLVVTSVTLIRHKGYGFTFARINDALQPFFRNHVVYSALLVFMVPIEIALLQLNKSRVLRALIYLSLAITLAALYLSYSRGAWLALITGITAYWLLRKKLLLLAFLLFVFSSVAFAFWLKSNDRYLQYAHDYKTTIFHKDFEEHLAATYHLKDVSTAERFYRWIAGVRMISDSWKTGFGPTTFYENYKSYAVPLFKTWVSKNEERSTVHNYFLLTIIEQGALGLAILFFLIGSLFWYAEKIYHRTKDKFWKVAIAAVAVILVMECTVNFLSDMIETDKVGSIFYLCIAVLITADVKTRKFV